MGKILSTVGAAQGMNRENQSALDMDRFERIADLRFKQETEQMYEEEISKAKQFFEEYENSGIAFAGKFLNRTADLVVTRFKTLERKFKEIYLEPLAQQMQGKLAKQPETWLRAKLSKVISDQVTTAQAMVKNLCFKFQPVSQDLFNRRWAEVQDEGRYMQQRLNEGITLAVLIAEDQKERVKKSAVEQAATADGVPGTQNHPRSFISYSWDNPAHKQWVLDFASRLRQEGGVEIILDQWHLALGADKNLFMENSIRESDFVIVICTQDYAIRADKRTGGVGYEAMIITGALAEKITQEKFIPILRSGDWESSIPIWLKTKTGIDFRGDSLREAEFETLLRSLHREPPLPPIVGSKPKWRSTATTPTSQEEKPHIELKAFQFPNVIRNIQTGVWHDRAEEGAHDYKACVLIFQNNLHPHGKGMDAVDLRAQIEWVYDNGSPGPFFSPAAWLDEEYGQINFPVGWTKKLLVGIRCSNHWTGHDNRRMSATQGQQTHSEILPFDGTMIVRLIDHTGQRLFEAKWKWTENLNTNWPKLRGPFPLDVKL